MTFLDFRFFLQFSLKFVYLSIFYTKASQGILWVDIIKLDKLKRPNIHTENIYFTTDASRTLTFLMVDLIIAVNSPDLISPGTQLLQFSLAFFPSERENDSAIKYTFPDLSMVFDTVNHTPLQKSVG